MKRIATAIACMTLLFSQTVLGETVYLEQQAAINKMYVPAGFDNNDEVEVILSGVLANSCHTLGDVHFKIDNDTKAIRIWAKELVKQDTFCLEVMTHYAETVKLGNLEVGTYTVEIVDDEHFDTLNIAEATKESPDEYLYAPVEKAAIQTDRAGRQSLVLEGELPHFFVGCMVIREVRTKRNRDDILVIQPIAEMTDGIECEEQGNNKAFKLRKGLEAPFEGEGLLHVRLFHGQSLNTLYRGL